MTKSSVDLNIKPIQHTERRSARNDAGPAGHRIKSTYCTTHREVLQGCFRQGIRSVAPAPSSRPGRRVEIHAAPVGLPSRESSDELYRLGTERLPDQGASGSCGCLSPRRADEGCASFLNLTAASRPVLDTADKERRTSPHTPCPDPRLCGRANRAWGGDQD